MLVACGLMEAVQQAGVPKEALLRDLAWSKERLQRVDRRLTLQELFQLCESAVRVTSDAALGLHWTERLRPSTFAPVSHMLSHVDTLREVFVLLSKFEQLFCDRRFFVLSEGNATATVRIQEWPMSSLFARRFTCEMILAGLTKMMRAVCPGATLLGARFDYPAPAYASEYTRALGVEVCFEEPASEIIFDRAWLSVPLPQGDPDVFKALSSVAERRLQLVSDQASYTVRLRELMLQRVPKRVSMPNAARALGLSERSLRRRLEDEGTTFRLVEYSAFAAHSKWMLCEQRLTVQQTALELGYSDTATFHHAFRRWTGMTPGACRLSLVACRNAPGMRHEK